MTTVLMPRPSTRPAATAYPLLDTVTDEQCRYLLFALKRAGYASWLELEGEAASLVTEAPLEAITAHCGAVLSFLK